MSTFTLPNDVMQALASEYERLPESPVAESAFAQLLHHALIQVGHHTTSDGSIALRDRFVHPFLSDHNPYHAFEQLRDDALIFGEATFDAVSDYGHPFWSGRDFAYYMLWHDLLGHVETGFDFTPNGELSLFAHHAGELLDAGETAAVAALFVEIVYRISHINIHGWTWQYKPVMPGPLAFHVMNQVLTGKEASLPEPFDPERWQPVS